MSNNQQLHKTAEKKFNQNCSLIDMKSVCGTRPQMRLTTRRKQITERLANMSGSRAISKSNQTVATSELQSGSNSTALSANLLAKRTQTEHEAYQENITRIENYIEHCVLITWLMIFNWKLV